MSTKTTPPKISEESRKKIESFHTTQQLYGELDEYIRNSSKSNKRAKERLAREINQLGNDYVKEIESEEDRYNQYASKVEYIIKTSGEKNGSLAQLNAMTYDEIDSIYEKAKLDSSKGFWSKLFDFIMGW